MDERRVERPSITIEGNLVALGPLRRNLLPIYHRWHNDVATLRTGVLPCQRRSSRRPNATFQLPRRPVGSSKRLARSASLRMPHWSEAVSMVLTPQVGSRPKRK